MAHEDEIKIYSQKKVPDQESKEEEEEEEDKEEKKEEKGEKEEDKEEENKEEEEDKECGPTGRSNCGRKEKTSTSRRLHPHRPQSIS